MRENLGGERLIRDRGRDFRRETPSQLQCLLENMGFTSEKTRGGFDVDENQAGFTVINAGREANELLNTAGA